MVIRLFPLSLSQKSCQSPKYPLGLNEEYEQGFFSFILEDLKTTGTTTSELEAFISSSATSQLSSYAKTLPSLWGNAAFSEPQLSWGRRLHPNPVKLIRRNSECHLLVTLAFGRIYHLKLSNEEQKMAFVSLALPKSNLQLDSQSDPMSCPVGLLPTLPA